MKIEVRDLCKSFDGKEVLHGISFDLKSGQALGLLGRNGAGKTTTIRILMDVFKANSGQITVDGKPFDPKRYQIGYMPEERGMYPKKKVLNQLLYFAQLRGISKSEARKNGKHLLQKLGISEYEDRRLETLSKGNQQKVQLAQTLICDPEIIILDEPFSGLDPVNSQILKDLIEEEIEKGKLVVFSSHQMGYVEEFCEDILILNKGEIVISGNLHQIQKEMGQNRGVLRVNDMDNETLGKWLEEKMSEYVRIEECKKDYVLFVFLKKKSEVLEKLSSLQLDIEVFGDYKPSLTDIFVWKAGE